MDDANFDGWTRRRFGLTTGGLLTSLAGLVAGGGDAAANRRRKECKSSEKRCGKKCVKGNCCPGKSCGQNCICDRTVGGRTFCWSPFIKVLCEQCESNADCEPPFHCVKTDGCSPMVTATCRPPCGFEP